MSYNPYFYKFRGNNATFQPHFVPPPPAPPPFFIPLIPSTEQVDKELVKKIEYKIPINNPAPITNKALSISEVREKLSRIIVSLNNLRAKEIFLMDNITTLSDDDWISNMKEVEENKTNINETLARINGPYLDVLRKMLTKRAAKRLRMKRVRIEIKREKEDKRRELEERSRKIDENLQKIKDDIFKAEQEQQAKLNADMVLKEILRKIHDAKKCIVKLDALVRLRKARHNTATGRGEVVSDSETAAFHNSIENMKSLWTRKLASYEIEEVALRAKLKEDSAQMECTNATERQVADNLRKWRDVLFGGVLPQVDFRGDVASFIAVRSQWDRYISEDGSAIPMGWVPPTK